MKIKNAFNQLQNNVKLLTNYNETNIEEKPKRNKETLLSNRLIKKEDAFKVKCMSQLPPNLLASKKLLTEEEKKYFARRATGNNCGNLNFVPVKSRNDHDGTLKASTAKSNYGNTCLDLFKVGSSAEQNLYESLLSCKPVPDRQPSGFQRRCVSKKSLETKKYPVGPIQNNLKPMNSVDWENYAQYLSHLAGLIHLKRDMFGFLTSENHGHRGKFKSLNLPVDRNPKTKLSKNNKPYIDTLTFDGNKEKNVDPSKIEKPSAETDLRLKKLPSPSEDARTTKLPDLLRETERNYRNSQMINGVRKLLRNILDVAGKSSKQSKVLNKTKCPKKTLVSDPCGSGSKNLTAIMNQIKTNEKQTKSRVQMSTKVSVPESSRECSTSQATQNLSQICKPSGLIGNAKLIETRCYSSMSRAAETDSNQICRPINFKKTSVSQNHNKQARKSYTKMMKRKLKPSSLKIPKKFTENDIDKQKLKNTATKYKNICQELHPCYMPGFYEGQTRTYTTLPDNSRAIHNKSSASQSLNRILKEKIKPTCLKVPKKFTDDENDEIKKLKMKKLAMKYKDKCRNLQPGSMPSFYQFNQSDVLKKMYTTFSYYQPPPPKPEPQKKRKEKQAAPPRLYRETYEPGVLKQQFSRNSKAIITNAEFLKQQMEKPYAPEPINLPKNYLEPFDPGLARRVTPKDNEVKMMEIELEAIRQKELQEALLAQQAKKVPKKTIYDQEGSVSIYDVDRYPKVPMEKKVEMKYKDRCRELQPNRMPRLYDSQTRNFTSKQDNCLEGSGQKRNYFSMSKSAIDSLGQPHRRTDLLSKTGDPKIARHNRSYASEEESRPLSRSNDRISKDQVEKKNLTTLSYYQPPPPKPNPPKVPKKPAQDPAVQTQIEMSNRPQIPHSYSEPYDPGLMKHPYPQPSRSDPKPNTLRIPVQQEGNSKMKMLQQEWIETTQKTGGYMPNLPIQKQYCEPYDPGLVKRIIPPEEIASSKAKTREVPNRKELERALYAQQTYVRKPERNIYAQQGSVSIYDADRFPPITKEKRVEMRYKEKCRNLQPSSMPGFNDTQTRPFTVGPSGKRDFSTYRTTNASSMQSGRRASQSVKRNLQKKHRRDYTLASATSDTFKQWNISDEKKKFATLIFYQPPKQQKKQTRKGVRKQEAIEKSKGKALMSKVSNTLSSSGQAIKKKLIRKSNKTTIIKPTSFKVPKKFKFKKNEIKKGMYDQDGSISIYDVERYPRIPKMKRMQMIYKDKCRGLQPGSMPGFYDTQTRTFLTVPHRSLYEHRANISIYKINKYPRLTRQQKLENEYRRKCLALQPCKMPPFFASAGKLTSNNMIYPRLYPISMTGALIKRKGNPSETRKPRKEAVMLVTEQMNLNELPVSPTPRSAES